MRKAQTLTRNTTIRRHSADTLVLTSELSFAYNSLGLSMKKAGEVRNPQSRCMRVLWVHAIELRPWSCDDSSRPGWYKGFADTKARPTRDARGGAMLTAGAANLMALRMFQRGNNGQTDNTRPSSAGREVASDVCARDTAKGAHSARLCGCIRGVSGADQPGQRAPL